MRTFNFIIVNYGSGDNQIVHPIFADGFGIVSERESGQIFFRNKLSDKLTFVAEDYLFIMSQPFDSQIDVFIQVLDDGVVSLTWHGTFSRTDCIINEVDGIISVTPEVKDDYTDILNCLDTEYNLADLAIPNCNISFTVPPVLQLYQQGQDVVTCYWQGETWQNEVDATSNRNDIIAAGFYSHYGYCRPYLTAGITAQFPPYAYFRDYHTDANFNVTDTTSTYTLNVEISDDGQKHLTLKQGGTILGRYHGYADSGFITDEYDNVVCHFTLDLREVFARILDGAGGATQITEKYFANIAKIYRYAKPILAAYGIDIITSTNVSNVPTKYGQVYVGGVPTGQYYTPPSDANFVYLPYAITAWDGFSVWIRVDKTKTTAMDTTLATRTFRDGYAIGDIVRALITANGLNIYFNDSPLYSQFLYDTPTTPITNWASGWRLIFTAKSNMVNLGYSEPASEVPCTLATVLNFLKNAMNVYWSVNGGVLRLEHVKYYKNGGTYSGTPTTQYNLTEIANPRSGKPWAFGQNQYQFEKYEMPEYVKWQWMDTTDKYFDGSGFHCISNLVAKGRTEEISVSNITTNITAMMTRPDKFSLDGFAVIFADANDKTTFSLFDRSDGAQWETQNGELSMWQLQPKLLAFDAPCDKIRISGALRTGVDYKRTKYNEVTFPALTVDPVQHITTNVGDGAPETITYDLTSNSVKVKLKYGNE